MYFFSYSLQGSIFVWFWWKSGYLAYTLVHLIYFLKKTSISISFSTFCYGLIGREMVFCQIARKKQKCFVCHVSLFGLSKTLRGRKPKDLNLGVLIGLRRFAFKDKKPWKRLDSHEIETRPSKLLCCFTLQFNTLVFLSQSD